MIKAVTITCTVPVVVISHRQGDRERFENGRDIVMPGKPRDILIDEDQPLAIELYFEPPPLEPDPELDAQVETIGAGDVGAVPAAITEGGAA